MTTPNTPPATPTITGREPHLPKLNRKQGRWKLSLRGLGTMFNVLPAEAISLDAAAAALHHTEYYVRYNSAKLLCRRADRDARLIMEEALRTGKAPTRASVSRFLYGFSWFAAKPLLLKAFEDSDARVREGAIYALCDYRQLDAYEMMVEVLQNEEDQVRAAAIWGLRENRDPACVPVIKATLLATDPEVRIKALELLGANDIPQAIPVVEESLADPEPDVKYAATMSLLELAGEKCVLDLLTLIQNTKNGPDKIALWRGFFHATNYLRINLTQDAFFDITIQTIEETLADSDPQVRMVAVWPLAWLHQPRTDAILKRIYAEEKDPQVKTHILYVTFNLLSMAGEEMLADALQSDIPALKAMAESIKQDLAEGNISVAYR